MKFSITHQYDAVSIENDEYLHILDLLSWKETPIFIEPGRTAWHRFSSPLIIKNYTQCKVWAAKLKGVGLWNPLAASSYSGVHSVTFNEKPIGPETREYEYTARTSHIGFANDGAFRITYGEPAPFGGILHERAVNEYNNALTLLNKGVHATIPLLAVQYEDRFLFHGKPMGAVVSLAQVTYPSRLHGLLFYDEQQNRYDYYQLLISELGISGEFAHAEVRLRALKEIGRKLGEAIRGFSEAGLYRYSGGLDNFLFCTQCKKVCLTDLDSSRPLRELPDNVKPLQVLRDLISILYKFLHRLGHPQIVNQYTLDAVLHNDVLAQVIEGYFPEVKEKHQATLQKASNTLWKMYIPHFFLLKRNSQELARQPNIAYNQYQIDRDLFFALALHMLLPIYQASMLNAVYPSNFNEGELIKRIKIFLQDRYEYFEHLLAS